MVGLHDAKALDSTSGLRFKSASDFSVFHKNHSLSLLLTMCFELPKHNKYVNHSIDINVTESMKYVQTIPSLCTQKCDPGDIRLLSFITLTVTV